MGPPGIGLLGNSRHESQILRVDLKQKLWTSTGLPVLIQHTHIPMHGEQEAVEGAGTAPPRGSSAHGAQMGSSSTPLLLHTWKASQLPLLTMGMGAVLNSSVTAYWLLGSWDFIVVFFLCV